MTRKKAAQRVALAGELTIFTAQAVRAQILAALDEAREVEVDLALVTETDCSGIQLMVAAKREAGEKKMTLRFTGHSPAILEALDLTDLSARLGDPVLIQSRC